ncbi:MAG: heat-inducible transcriptional repressor HrcA [Fimbriimonadaceae bacterium]
MQELDPRKQSLLKAIIIEYVSAAEPVASEMLVQKYDLGVKSATIRNEMAEMSEMGFLEQPHTSAGRIPSDRGYRFYVDRLITRAEPTASEKHKLQAASEDGEALQELLRDTTRTLSRLTHQFSAAAIVRDGALTIRNTIISALGPHQALLVVVLNNGHVENRMIECPPGLTLTEVGQANEALNSATTGKALGTVLRGRAPAMPQPAAEKLMASVWHALRAIAKEITRGTIITEGEEFIFAQPEFQRDVAALTMLLDHLKESDLLHEAAADQTQAVSIGRENRHEHLHSLSLVRQSFFVGENEAGWIAIVGPTRMAYEHGIPLVGFTARALSRSLTRFFG